MKNNNFNEPVVQRNTFFQKVSKTTRVKRGQIAGSGGASFVVAGGGHFFLTSR
jgi:hypothetical protein